MKYKVSIKPVYNFQSIEVSFETDDLQEVSNFVDAEYEELLESLKEITDYALKDEQQRKQQYNNSYNRPQRRETELATQRQIDIMNQYGIEYDDFTTREEARKLISDSYKKTR